MAVVVAALASAAYAVLSTEGDGQGAALAIAAVPTPPLVIAEDPVRLTVVASGDFLVHSPVFRRALALGDGRYDFVPMFRYIRKYVKRADLAICHVETPMTNGPPSGYPLFNTPPALARAIKQTGWDVCDTASNHTLDRGQNGIRATIRHLNRVGVCHTGSFLTRAQRRRAVIIIVKGLRVAFSPTRSTPMVSRCRIAGR